MLRIDVSLHQHFFDPPAYLPTVHTARVQTASSGWVGGMWVDGEGCGRLAGQLQKRSEVILTASGDGGSRHCAPRLLIVAQNVPVYWGAASKCQNRRLIL